MFDSIPRRFPPGLVFVETLAALVDCFLSQQFQLLLQRLVFLSLDALSVNEKLHLQNAVFGRHQELLVHKNETELGLDLQKQIYLNVSFFKIYRHSIKAYLLVYEQKT